MTHTENLIHPGSHKSRPRRGLFHGWKRGAAVGGGGGGGIVPPLDSTSQSARLVRDPAFENEPRSRHCFQQIMHINSRFLVVHLCELAQKCEAKLLKIDLHGPLLPLLMDEV